MKKDTLLLLLILFFFVNVTVCSATNLPSVAFYYGHNMPMAQFRAFSVVVVEPYKSFDPKKFNTEHSKAFAYVSVGELNLDAAANFGRNVDSSWVLGSDKTWGTRVMDNSNPKWRNYLLTKIAVLWKRGYRGFFLDTLDSYQSAVKDQEGRDKQVQGITDLIKEIKHRYPEAKLILNRGFEVLPSVYKLVYAVAAESMYRGWNEGQKKYVAVKQQDQQWLRDKLIDVKDEYKLPVIVIDYLPASRRQEAEKDAANISKLGFIPYVTNGNLTVIGVGSVEVLPRKVLLFYIGKKISIPFNPLFNYVGMPLQYLGYIPIMRTIKDINRMPKISRDRYAGVVVWSDSPNINRNRRVQSFLYNVLNKREPLLIMGTVGDLLNNTLQKRLSLVINNKIEKKNNSAKIIFKSKDIGYEADPRINIHEFVEFHTKTGKPLLVAKTAKGRTSDLIAITPWGGYLPFPFVNYSMPNGLDSWVVNPISFLQKTLRLSSMPVPDVTTENGKRLMMVHVDGDGFTSKAERYKGPFAGEEMLQKIFNYYRVPTTVSIIQSDMSPDGLNPLLSSELEAIAKKIFALPWVEIASHSYSHPYVWQKDEKKKIGYELPDKSKVFYSSIPGYRFNIETEIKKSVQYINERLAPPGKKCKVFLWTGDAHPSSAAVALTYKLGLLNMNGGGATITNSKKSLFYVAALGVYKGQYFQVYAPMQNENMYTNLWGGPFHGFRRVVETFKLTDKPYRLKPIDIYYHFYSATKIASLRALKFVYDWALKQDVFNIFASEYIEKVLDFNNIVVAKVAGGWLINSRGDLREYRLPQKMGNVDLVNSENIVGYSKYGKDYYIHAADSDRTLIRVTEKIRRLPFLQEANARVSGFKRKKHGLDFLLEGHMPISFSLKNAENCKVFANNKQLSWKNTKNGVKEYKIPGSTTAKIAVQCGG